MHGDQVKSDADERWFRSTFDNLLEGIQIHDFEWRYIYVNDALVKYSTYAKHELLGFTLMEKYPGIEQSALFQVLSTCMHDRIPHYLETEFVFPNSTKAYFQLSIQPIPEGIFILSLDITERKKAETALKLAETNYRELFDNATDAIYVLEIETGQILEANQKASEVTGYAKEELHSMYAVDFIVQHPAYSGQKMAVYLQDAVQGVPQQFEWRSKRKDGSTTWLEMELKKVSLAGEARILAFFREINDRKKNEEAILQMNEQLEQKVLERTAQLESHIFQLKESEERFQKAFQASAGGIAITRLADGKYLDVNDAFLNMMGYTKEEVIGNTSVGLGMMIDPARREVILQKIRQDGSARHFELSVRHKSGKILEVLSSAEIIWLNGEKYAINIIFDITERKRIEEQLKKSDALFFSLFEHNPASLAISRMHDRKLINANTAFLGLFGFSKKEEVQGKTVAELHVFQDAHKWDEMALLAEENNKVYNLEMQTCTRQGELRWASISIIKIELDDAPCLLTVLLDITELKSTEEQLHALNKELEAFTYSVSHDLRAPLRSASGYAQILLEDYGDKLDEQGKRNIDIIKSNAMRMGNLIDDLLAFSQLGRKEPRKREIDMNDLVKSVKEEIRRASPFRTKIEIGPLHSMKADYNLLHQVVYNLLSNAIKYSSLEKDPRVKIMTEEVEDTVVFSIQDNGTGFDMQYVDKLFGVFQRLHAQEEFEGTGVGLAIVQRIVLKHGGKVWAEGQKGKGAIFYFSLPKG